MRRSSVLFAALLGLLLAACAPANTARPSATGTTAPATNALQATGTTPATAVGQAEAAKPVATPDIAQIIKAQPDDWKRGPEGAKVTIIEWGDFQ